jgi:hypothetical protein
MKDLTLEQLIALMHSKEDAMRKLCYHKNNSLAKERWNDYQSELAMIRKEIERRTKLNQ